MWTVYTGASLILEKIFSRSSFYDMTCFSIFASGPHLDPTTTSENILRRSSIEAITLIVDHLFGCLSCFSRSRIQHIIYCLKSRSLRSSFGWSTMKKFSEVTALGVGPFQNVQREVIYFLLVVRKNLRELFKHFSIHCKSRGISGPYNFLTRIKNSIPDV